MTAWYTPAFFTGRLLVNTATGTVEYFRLELPTDKALNVHLTVDALGYTRQAHDIVRVERMELAGHRAHIGTGLAHEKDAVAGGGRTRNCVTDAPDDG